ncbi:unnamed protein product [Prunus armeniaca]
MEVGEGTNLDWMFTGGGMDFKTVVLVGSDAAAQRYAATRIV